jgi:hypothetical protein
MSRYYAQYWIDTPYVDQRGWRVYDRELTYGNGEVMPIAQCWTRDAAFQIRDLLNASVTPKQMPFPVFTLVDPETSYQTYHRAFRDGWKAAQP